MHTERYSWWSLFKHGLRHNRDWQPAYRRATLADSYDVIIIGGGGHGLATAYYLAKEHRPGRIAVLERGWLGGGNTARNTTIVRSNYLWDEAAALFEHSLRLWEGLTADLNFNVLFSQRGVYNLGHTLQDMPTSCKGWTSKWWTRKRSKNASRCLIALAAPVIR